ncbi:MAG: SCP2 sterol-binding domain-containing protein, partial [Desulfobacterales bacterium]|nr:SCP2 sterol-binding domain-containing protein [Desulfobacterales bacterium]
GSPVKPDCTLDLSDQDFMDMTAGKADPMKLFTTGKLKISGDIMKSQLIEKLFKFA